MIHPETTMGAVGLIVADLNRSLRYYHENIGLHVHRRTETQVWLGAGGPDLLVLTEQPGARPVQRGRTGLYHFALLVPSRADLARVIRHLVDTRTSLAGMSDHGVSEALYLQDPDGHGIEIYRDRPRAEWPVSGGELQMVSDPLDVPGMLAEVTAGKVQWHGMAPGTTIGHVHLHVHSIPAAEAFYCGVLGFELMQRWQGQASFVAAGGYHHHLGLNVWAGVGAPPPPDDAARLDWFEIVLPTDSAYADAVARLQGNATELEVSEALGVTTALDPSGNRLRLINAHHAARGLRRRPLWQNPLPGPKTGMVPRPCSRISIAHSGDDAPMQTHARLVIIGGGIVGCSAAYHLAQLGWRDILVLDKGPLPYNDGSTSHAPGGMHLTNSSKMMTEFAMYTRALIATLEQPDPDAPFYRPVGGIEVAYTKERLEDLKRRHGWATAYGLEGHLISPAEVKEKIPVVDDQVILGGYWVPHDTNIGGWQTARAIAQAAEATGGVQFVPETEVFDVEIERGHVRAVLTSGGRVECEAVLLCTNIWAPVLGEKVGLRIPLLAAQHQYTISSPLEELQGETKEVRHPLMRHQDYSLYFRQHHDCYGIGNYRHVPLMVSPWTLGKTAMLPFTPEHYEVAWKAARELIPGLKGTTLTKAFNGMFAFTVDGYPVIGEAPTVQGVLGRDGELDYPLGRGGASGREPDDSR